MSNDFLHFMRLSSYLEIVNISFLLLQKKCTAHTWQDVDFD